ncbi:MAG: NAD(P)-dependent oxidoreductase, partial [Candidatus Izemoplasmatales bacterium]
PVQPSEDILTKILVMNRNVKHYYQAMERGSWEPIMGEPELTDATVGVLGTGSIGRELAKKIQGFATRLIGYRRSIGEVIGFSEIYHGEQGLRKVIQESDYLVVALPLNRETKGLLDKEKLALMKPSALLINVGRGEVVDQEALANLLKNRHIRGAALDVTTPEPLPPDHELWRMDHVFITPHNAVSSPQLPFRLAKLSGDNLARFLNHEPVVNQVR